MLAGGLAGLCQIIVTTPMELLKIRMQDAGRLAAQANQRWYLNQIWFKFLKEIFLETLQSIQKLSATRIACNLMKTNGFFGLYKGVVPTIFRDVSFSVIYFPLFATLNNLGPRKRKHGGKFKKNFDFEFALEK